MKKIIVTFLISFLAGVAVGATALYVYFTKYQKSVVVEKVVVKDTQYIVKPTTCEGYKRCYESKINIQATAKDNVVYIRAFDGCKSADAEITVNQEKDASGCIVTGVVAIVTAIIAIILF